MNILVIGNGFDLAHGLPTGYMDFLDWIVGEYEFFDILKQEQSEITKGRKKPKLNIPEKRETSICINRRIEHQIELWDCMDDNNWIEHFLYRNMGQKRNWIDFETEISNVIKSIEDDMQGNMEGTVARLENWTLSNKYIDNKLDFGDGGIKYINFVELRDILLSDLNRLIRAFEIYLCDYIEQIEIEKKSPDIEELEIDYILSLNYTHTFSKLYKISGKAKKKGMNSFDFIHGEANINGTLETNNMVLGIDEYLPVERRNKEIEFIAFKKYYQRIFKGTGCRYKEWLFDMKERSKTIESELKHQYPAQIPFEKFTNDARNNLYILGHSLDETDKDILRDLILNDNVYTTIFYYSKNDLGAKIANLVKVLEQDELIKRTGGSTKTIEFKLQQDMVEI